jgi:hypothetical protein
MSTTTRNYVRHAGDHSPEWLALRDERVAERQAELDARQAALRESDPELAAAVEAKMRRRR